MEFFVKSSGFLRQIIDGMYDWVRVLDTDNNILFLNKAMSDAFDCHEPGEKCYELIGRSSPCENCTSHKSIFDGKIYEKTEEIGEKIYTVVSSPVRNEKGDIVAVVEVLRDMTESLQLQQKIIKQNKKLQDDLSMARKLQCSLLPRPFSSDSIKASFIYKPCESLGGDFLDIFKIDRDNVGIYIADVSGHGVPASLLTVFLRSSINKKIISPAQALTELYRDFSDGKFDQDLYITVFYAIINTREYCITYSNAGHNVYPVLYGNGRYEFLSAPGIPISNWMENPDYQDKCTQLQKGDNIFLCTDGVIELKNEKKEQFGEERILNLLLESKEEPVSVLNRIIDNISEFSGISDFSEMPDDLTMALLEIL